MILRIKQSPPPPNLNHKGKVGITKFDNMVVMKSNSSPSFASKTSINKLSRFLIFVLGFSFGMVVGFHCNFKSLSFDSITSFSSPILASASESRPLLSVSPPGLSSVSPPPPLSPPPPQLTPPSPVMEEGSLMHKMSDSELVSRALEVGESANSMDAPKVAFMFMVKGKVHLGALWDKFFEGHQGYFSIYVHAHPSFNEPIPKDSVFHGRNIPSQEVLWGTMTMMDAEKRLLANALLDPSNKMFVLLSESCIPLFNFTTIYNYLIESDRSFLGCLDILGRDGRQRYNKTMAPEIPQVMWRKGSEWFEIRRDLALKIIEDKKYYNIFKEHCHKPCFSDEHYLPTMVHILYSNMNHNRSLMWVDWAKGGPHPSRYGWGDISEELINRMRFGSNCTYNGVVTNFCFLFARKFLPSALEPLLRLAPTVLGFGH